MLPARLFLALHHFGREMLGYELLKSENALRCCAVCVQGAQNVFVCPLLRRFLSKFSRPYGWADDDLGLSPVKLPLPIEGVLTITDLPKVTLLKHLRRLIAATRHNDLSL